MRQSQDNFCTEGWTDPNSYNTCWLGVQQGFYNVQYLNTMPNIFQRKKLVTSMSQASNLGRLLCKSTFE